MVGYSRRRGRGSIIGSVVHLLELVHADQDVQPPLRIRGGAVHPGFAGTVGGEWGCTAGASVAPALHVPGTLAYPCPPADRPRLRAGPLTNQPHPDLPAPAQPGDRSLLAATDGKRRSHAPTEAAG